MKTLTRLLDAMEPPAEEGSWIIPAEGADHVGDDCD